MHLCFYLLLLILSACGGNTQDAKNRTDALKKWKEPNGKIKVLSTTAMIDDVVKQIGREHVDTLTLIQGELDPHSYQLVKGDGENLARANLIFYSGLGLEHGPSLQQYLQDNQNAIGLGNKIQENAPELIVMCQGQPDPHIWMDISLWARTVPFIVEALSEKDSAHKEYYLKNAEALLSKMQLLHGHLREELQSIPEEKRYLVTSHDAFNYFARAYLATDEEVKNDQWFKRVAAPEGLAPDSQLGATDIQGILDHVALYDIHVLFAESNVSKDSIRKILTAGEEKGLKLRIANPALYSDAIGKKGSDGDTYMKMVEHNAKTIGREISE